MRSLLERIRLPSICTVCTCTRGPAKEAEFGRLPYNGKLENVAIANALQIEAARRRAVPIRFHFAVRAKFEVAQRLRAFLLLIRYITL